jgi:hypothetical protein
MKQNTRAVKSDSAPVKAKKRPTTHSDAISIGSCVLKSRPKRKKPRFVFVNRRLGDMRLIAKYLWPTGQYSNDFLIPDSEQGKEFVELWVQHGKHAGHSRTKLQSWAEKHAPWYGTVDTRGGPSRVSNRLPTAETMGRRLKVTAHMREAINSVGPGRRGKIATIAPCDQTPEEHKMSAKERKTRQDRGRRQAERRAAGAQSRAEYECQSLVKTKPWKTAGVSRAQWYRQNAALGVSRATYYRNRSETRNETSPSRVTLVLREATHLSHLESHRESPSISESVNPIGDSVPCEDVCSLRESLAGAETIPATVWPVANTRLAA